MVGSEDSIGSPNTTLNAIVAEAFCEAADRLEKAEDFDVALQQLVCKAFTEHQRIIFNGNSYSQEWEEEAEKRGLDIDAVNISALHQHSCVDTFGLNGNLAGGVRHLLYTDNKFHVSVLLTSARCRR